MTDSIIQFLKERGLAQEELVKIEENKVRVYIACFSVFQLMSDLLRFLKQFLACSYFL